jgi:hypothetical protein
MSLIDSPARWLASLLLLALAVPARADEAGWIDLSSDTKAREGWEKLTDDWAVAGNAALDPKNSKKLVDEPGDGVLVNTPKGRAPNLVTKQKFTDAEVHVEFLIPKGSNSGVKLMGLYEIQIYDSHGKKDLDGSDCGGIYPRAEEQPKYRHIDKGTPPRVNAAKPPGEWQTLDIVFRAPRFDPEGKKTANARFVKVVLNGEVIHEDVDVEYPTGSAWRLKKETATGPLLLQGDHGPVAFRNVRIRPMTEGKKKD